MRDDEASRPRSDPLPLAVLVRTDPMPDEQRPGLLRVALTALGAVAVVGLVFYGLTCPEPTQQMAAAPVESQTAPAGGGAANNAGQGAGEHAGQPETNGQSQPKDEAGPSKTPPAAGNSATGAVVPEAKPAPQAK